MLVKPILLVIIAGAAVVTAWRDGPRTDAAPPPLAACGARCRDTDARLRPLMDKYHRPADIPYPDENPYSAAKYRLGQSLFFDPSLSRSGAMACATCHKPSMSWGDGRARALGDLGELPIRAPTLLNLAWIDIMGWDGKFPSLEAVTFAPIASKSNMGLSEPVALERLAASPAYVDAFKQAFPGGAITRENVENAVATYERGIVSPAAPFDRWIEGDGAAVSAQAKRGFALFNGRAGCANCHSGWSFTDGSFHDIGTATGTDRGRGLLFPSSVKLQYAFKTPTLRDVARRAPYMHDGSVPDLQAAIELYNRGGIDRPSRAEFIKPLGLSPQDKADLLAFLDTLTSDLPPITLTDRSQ